MDRFNDPRTMALLGAAQGLFKAGQPSQFPTGFGQALNAGVQGGVQGVLSSQQGQLANSLKRAQLEEIKRKTAEAEQNRKIRERLFGGFGLLPGGAPSETAGPEAFNERVQQELPPPERINLPAGPSPGGLGVLAQGASAPAPTGAPAGILAEGNNPERIEALGTYLAMTGDPGAATLLNVADRIRARNEERQAAEGFKSRPGILGAGVTTSSPQGQALLGNLSGDPGFDRAVLSAQNEALNSNTRIPSQPILAERPGLFGPLMASPHVGPVASQLQQQLNVSPGVKPAQWLQQFSHLQQQDAGARAQAIAREENASVRRELADQTDTTRRELFAQGDETRRMLGILSQQGRREGRQGTEDNRAFTQERSLANDYNRLSADYRGVLPSFQASARYVAGQKYTSSGDRDLAFAFARTLDPKDRVGVNDIRDINKLGNVPERIQQAIVGLAEGKELPPRVRQEMFDTMRNRFKSMNELQQQIEDEYEARAAQYMLAPNRIVQRFAVRGQTTTPSPSPAAPTNRVTGRIDATNNDPQVIDFRSLPRGR